CNRIFEKISSQIGKESWKDIFKYNINGMQEDMNKKTTWRNDEIKLKTSQIVDAFVNTELKQLIIYRDWEFCHDVPFVVPIDLQAIVVEEDKSFVASIVLLAESCRETADPNKITGNREKIT
ncbi:19_t:CDS:2, partial [Entrophospora sp. SA101]